MLNALRLRSVTMAIAGWAVAAWLMMTLASLPADAPEPNPAPAVEPVASDPASDAHPGSFIAASLRSDVFDDGKAQFGAGPRREAYRLAEGPAPARPAGVAPVVHKKTRATPTTHESAPPKATKVPPTPSKPLPQSVDVEREHWRHHGVG